jgi:predicted ATPase
MSALRQPVGLVTLVFTDIEGSTKLLEELGASAYREALAEHRRIVRGACSRHQGYEVDYEGDAFFYAFPSAPQALRAVREAMAGLAEGPIRIRVGIHSGEPELDPPKYVGMDVHLAARIMACAHGGQVVLSRATRDLLDGLALTDLGEHRLKDIAEPVAIFQLGDSPFPPLKTISNTNLPRPASSFVGRERELAEVLSRIDAGARLLTLTGPGGSGKTRLALEAAATLVPQYKAGVFWVGLAALRDPALVTETIAQTLGAKDGLAAHVGERELLLLLDNLEHVVEAAPELSAFLSACPNLTLLCTSRELLRVSGEVEYSVPSLTSPEAVALFCERAQLERSEEIAELCARLDKLPLAIELAAARAKALSPVQILERLSQRLDLLKGGRDADPRQQTLRATIEWSYELLSDEEQQLFAGLSVFAGGCTLAAAEEVAGADLDTLQSLVEKSLLRFTNERYSMLETIREYALERLDATGMSARVARAHAAHYLELTDGLKPLLVGPEEPAAFDSLASEHDNLRAALRFLVAAGEQDLALGLVNPALQRFWRVRGMLAEGRHWLEEVLRSDDGDPLLRANALRALANIAGQQGDVERMLAAAKEALDAPEASTDPILMIDCCVVLGGGMTRRGDLAEARRYFEQAERLSRRVDDRFRLGAAIGNLGNVAMYEADYERARELFRESVELSREIGLDEAVAYSLGNEASAAFYLGDYDGADKLLRMCFELSSAVASVATTAYALEGLAAVSSARGDCERAATLLGAARALEEEVGFELEPFEQRMHDNALEQARAALSPERLERAWDAGRSMTPEDVAAVALGAKV